MHKAKKESLLLENLKPEELDPRLEMQILFDPMAVMEFQTTNEINCKAGSNCCAEGGECTIKLG